MLSVVVSLNCFYTEQQPINHESKHIFLVVFGSTTKVCFSVTFESLALTTIAPETTAFDLFVWW